MTRKCALFLAVFVALSLPSLLGEEPVPLPVRNVELYKNGMGFFEHRGAVRGDQTVEITLPGSQLNDVLKSLTVLDLGGGQVSGVNYDSVAPLERRLAEMPIDLASNPGLVPFLNQLRGAAVEVRTPSGPVAGKLMGAQTRTRTVGNGETVQEILLSLLTAEGQVRLVEMESAGALGISDDALAGDLGRHLEVLASGHRRDIRTLRIRTAGSGERELYIGYTSEAPIWKTTYRIVIDPGKKPLLQGWAIVDNTTPMDWTDVSLALVAGAPVSFIQDLAQPIYGRRPVIPIAQGVQVRPQTYEATLDLLNLLDLEDEEAADAAYAEERALKSTARGTPGGVAGGVLAAAPAAPAPARVSEAMRRQAAPAAQAGAVGDQFEYRLRRPVTIRRNESALLPILQSDVEGEKVSVFREDGGQSHPRLAFWLRNSSGLTLDGGPVTLIDGNAFAGEGLFETIQPGENRLLDYAVDLGTVVSTAQASERRRVERVVIRQGTMRLISKLAEKKTYRIRNNSDTARSVVLEHPVRAGWTLVGAKPDETSANFYRFKVAAGAKATVTFVVEEESPHEMRFTLSSVTPDQVEVWVRDRFIDPETERQLGAITARQAEIVDLGQRIAALEKEQNDIFRDQERVRQNLERLGQGPDEAALRLRYIRQLDSQENRITAMKGEREKLEAERAAAERKLGELIAGLTVDRAL
ncbi:MAG: hypothetical protein QM330_03610 [Acidobacteriota bacterium]|nr:hypothetical protein [Acidobacteriota bacterium]